MNNVSCTAQVANTRPIELNSSYKKINHFIEIIKQIQEKEKEKHSVSDETMETIQNHITKYRLDIQSISVVEMKAILKKSTIKITL